MAEDVKLKLDDKGHGRFYIMDEETQVAEMVVSISAGLLTVYHTEVLPRAEGKGLAKQLLFAMVDHARSRGMKIIPLCPYVHAQFKRHPELYADVWYKTDQ